MKLSYAQTVTLACVASATVATALPRKFRGGHSGDIASVASVASAPVLAGRDVENNMLVGREPRRGRGRKSSAVLATAHQRSLKAPVLLPAALPPLQSMAVTSTRSSLPVSLAGAGGVEEDSEMLLNSLEPPPALRLLCSLAATSTRSSLPVTTPGQKWRMFRDRFKCRCSQYRCWPSFRRGAPYP
ncbi:hypothetical protein FPV67DRAFT_1147210 [Lyophyllum atratum]|nr:hypothetical protein FPV67DRAFT_1147210 [Lyophyllum atratum]